MNSDDNLRLFLPIGDVRGYSRPFVAAIQLDLWGGAFSPTPICNQLYIPEGELLPGLVCAICHRVTGCYNSPAHHPFPVRSRSINTAR
jgi:hypothetical protein